MRRELKGGDGDTSPRLEVSWLVSLTFSKPILEFYSGFNGLFTFYKYVSSHNINKERNKKPFHVRNVFLSQQKKSRSSTDEGGL